MDDIVVIVITILIAIMAALGQKKKRQQTEAAKQNQPQQPLDFWELLGGLSATEAAPRAGSNEVVEETEKPIDSVPVNKPAYQFSVKSEGKSDIPNSVFTEPKKKKRAALIDGEKFSLRKAVIYNEIMNRKYT